jgi:hypothetical protein
MVLESASGQNLCKKKCSFIKTAIQNWQEHICDYSYSCQRAQESSSKKALLGVREQLSLNICPALISPALLTLYCVSHISLHYPSGSYFAWD